MQLYFQLTELFSIKETTINQIYSKKEIVHLYLLFEIAQKIICSCMPAYLEIESEKAMCYKNLVSDNSKNSYLNYEILLLFSS